MAVIVPFLMSATGASAAIATAIGSGVTATMVSTVTAITFAVTGINDKINKAASKVFGEDLVNFANIAGMGYAMFNGGFDMGSGADAVGAATDAAGNLIPAPEISSAAWDATGAANMDAITAASAGVEPMNLSDMASYDDGSFMGKQSVDLAADPFEQDMADMMAGKEAISDTKTFDMLKAEPGMVDQSPKATTSVIDAATQPTVESATTPTATASVKPTATAANATKAITPTSAVTPTAPVTAPVAGETNFSKLINKLMYNNKGELNERLIGGVLQGGGQVAASYLQRSAQQKIADEQQARRDSMSRIRYA